MQFGGDPSRIEAMSFDPAKTGESFPGRSTPVASRASSIEHAPVGARLLGFTPSELEPALQLPTEVDMGRNIAAAKRPFFGAFVPLVLHDPLLGERSYDAAVQAR